MQTEPESGAKLLPAPQPVNSVQVADPEDSPAQTRRSQPELELEPEPEPEPEPENDVSRSLSAAQQREAGSWIQRAWVDQAVRKRNTEWNREEKQRLVDEVNTLFTRIGEKQTYTIEHLNRWLLRMYIGFGRAMRTFEPADGPDVRTQLAIQEGERLVIEKGALDKAWWRCRRQQQCILLKLNVHKATGVRSADWNGSSDPFVRAFFEGHEILTQEDSTVKFETLDPKWNEALTIRVPTGRSYASTIDGDGSLPTLVVRVYDRDLVGHDDFLGQVRIPPAEWAVVRSEALSHKLGLRVDEDGHEDSKFSHQITGDLELSMETRQVSIEDRGWVPAEYLGTHAPVSIPSIV